MFCLFKSLQLGVCEKRKISRSFIELLFSHIWPMAVWGLGLLPHVLCMSSSPQQSLSSHWPNVGECNGSPRLKQKRNAHLMIMRTCLDESSEWPRARYAQSHVC